MEMRLGTFGWFVGTPNCGQPFANVAESAEEPFAARDTGHAAGAIRPPGSGPGRGAAAMPHRKIDQGEPEDTEGNMPLRRGVESDEPETEDAEGNGIRVKIVKDAEPKTDDTEGNATRGKG